MKYARELLRVARDDTRFDRAIAIQPPDCNASLFSEQTSKRGCNVINPVTFYARREWRALRALPHL
jgi:hypothetical protein